MIRLEKNEYFISFNTIYRETVSHGKNGSDKQRHSGQTEKAEAVRNVIIKALKNEVVETITPDRGKEFAKHSHTRAWGEAILFSSATPPMSEGNKREYKWFIARVFSETKRHY